MQLLSSWDPVCCWQQLQAGHTRSHLHGVLGEQEVGPPHGRQQRLPAAAAAQQLLQCGGRVQRTLRCALRTPALHSAIPHGPPTFISSTKPTLYTNNDLYKASTAVALRPAATSCGRVSPKSAAPLPLELHPVSCCCCTSCCRLLQPASTSVSHDSSITRLLLWCCILAACRGGVNTRCVDNRAAVGATHATIEQARTSCCSLSCRSSSRPGPCSRLPGVCPSTHATSSALRVWRMRRPPSGKAAWLASSVSNWSVVCAGRHRAREVGGWWAQHRCRPATAPAVVPQRPHAAAAPCRDAALQLRAGKGRYVVGGLQRAVGCYVATGADRRCVGGCVAVADVCVRHSLLLLCVQYLWVTPVDQES
jgi:hypothetical protein